MIVGLQACSLAAVPLTQRLPLHGALHRGTSMGAGSLAHLLRAVQHVPTIDL